MTRKKRTIYFCLIEEKKHAKRTDEGGGKKRLLYVTHTLSATVSNCQQLIVLLYTASNLFLLLTRFFSFLRKKNKE